MSAENETPTDKALLDMAEKVGSFIEYWGFKQVHGKVWTLLFLSPEPMDANYLKDTLQISKALTSMTLKDLQTYKVIEEVEKDRPGTQKYRINPNITQVILDIINQREVVMLNAIMGQYQSLSEKQGSQPSSHVDNARLAELGQMVTMAHGLLEGMASGQNVDFNLFDQAMQVTRSN